MSIQQELREWKQVFKNFAVQHPYLTWLMIIVVVPFMISVTPLSIPMRMILLMPFLLFRGAIVLLALVFIVLALIGIFVPIKKQPSQK